MDEFFDREDELILDLVGQLSSPPDGGGRAADTHALLRKSFQEVLGLLPWELELIVPSPEVRTAVLATVANVDRTEVNDPEDFSIPRMPAGLIPTGSGKSWRLPLAAALGLLLLGSAAWLQFSLEKQRQIVSKLEHRLVELSQQAAASHFAERRLALSESNLALVTNPAVEICRLRPPAKGGDAGRSATGTLFVASDHQHWYLSLSGLTPLPDGMIYRLWFVGPDGAVSAGEFSATETGVVNVGSSTMPANTRGVRITLEPLNQSPAPSIESREILYGDEMIRLF